VRAGWAFLLAGFFVVSAPWAVEAVSYFETLRSLESGGSVRRGAAVSESAVDSIGPGLDQVESCADRGREEIAQLLLDLHVGASLASVLQRLKELACDGSLPSVRLAVNRAVQVQREEGGRPLPWLTEYSVLVKVNGPEKTLNSYVDSIGDAGLPVWADSILLSAPRLHGVDDRALTLRLKILVPAPRA